MNKPTALMIASAAACLAALGVALYLDEPLVAIGGGLTAGGLYILYSLDEE